MSKQYNNFAMDFRQSNQANNMIIQSMNNGHISKSSVTIMQVSGDDKFYKTNLHHVSSNQ